MPALFSPNELAARIRRDVERSVLRARNGLKLVAAADPPGVGLTPKDTVWRYDKLELWRYRGDGRRHRPPVLLVMSLVSRSYILDLRPGNSFVEFLLGRGFDVFLLDWGVADELEAGNTLETYCDEYLPRAAAAACEAAGSDELTLFGYCFGGLLTLLYAAGHPGPPTRNVVVMATPIDFSKMGPMTALIQEGRLDPDDLLDDTGNVPADLVGDSFRMLKPTQQVSGYVTLWEHLWNDEYVEAYQAMDRWTRDQVPFPGATFRQVTEQLTRRNDLVDGRMWLGGREVDFRDITVPFLNVVAEKDHIVPAAAVGPLTQLVGSEDRTELLLPAGHVGLVVGRSAQKRTMPAMADWLERHSTMWEPG